MKRSKKMLMLLIVLVLCIGGYYGVQMLNADTASVTEETGTFALNSHTADDLTGLSWTNGDEDFAFTLSDGAWSLTSDPAFPLNQEDVQSMADDLLALVGTRQLDGVSDLAAYGLAEPTFSVVASWSDGTSITYARGDETPFGDGYYLSLGHENIIYTIKDDIADIFDTTMNNLAVLENIPATTAVTRLTVGGGSAGSTSLDIVKSETSRTINEGELWYDSMTGAALDTAAAEDLIADAQAISWSELAEPTASPEELTTFGVDEASAVAITLYEGETAAMTLLIGAQNDAGSYYARLPGSTMVYTVASRYVSSLLTASAETIPSMVIIDLSAKSVHSATFTAGEAVHTWVASTSEDAEDEAAAAELGESLWDSILALEASKRIETADGTPILTVEVAAANSLSAMLTFTEYDAQSYAVTVQERSFLVDAAEVDAIIRTLRAGIK